MTIAFTGGKEDQDPLPSEYTGVPHLYENAPPYDPTAGLCLGAYGDPRGVGVFFLMGEVPLQHI